LIIVLKTAIGVSQPPVFGIRMEHVPLEVVALQGFIAEGQPHVHVVVSDDKQAVAGHLEESRILFVGEIVIQELIGQEFTREPISASLNQIVVKNEEPERS
jgi:predicted DNA-binding protein with PD1-like motif